MTDYTYKKILKIIKKARKNPDTDPNKIINDIFNPYHQQEPQVFIEFDIRTYTGIKYVYCKKTPEQWKKIHKNGSKYNLKLHFDEIDGKHSSTTSYFNAWDLDNVCIMDPNLYEKLSIYKHYCDPFNDERYYLDSDEYFNNSEFSKNYIISKNQLF